MTRICPAIALSVGALLAGCQLEATITVVGDGPQPRFDVTYDRGKTACVQALNVIEQTGDTRRKVWAIRQSDAKNGAPCAANIGYGVTPANYEVVVPAAPLAPGRRYAVNASGIGWHAKAPLTVR